MRAPPRRRRRARSGRRGAVRAQGAQQGNMTGVLVATLQDDDGARSRSAAPAQHAHRWTTEPLVQLPGIESEQVRLEPEVALTDPTRRLDRAVDGPLVGERREPPRRAVAPTRAPRASVASSRCVTMPVSSGVGALSRGTGGRSIPMPSRPRPSMRRPSSTKRRGATRSRSRCASGASGLDAPASPALLRAAPACNSPTSHRLLDSRHSSPSLSGEQPLRTNDG